MLVDVTPTAIVIFKTATTPFEMMPASDPEATQVYAPAPPKQLTVFDAAVDADPEATEIAATLLAG